MLQTFTVFSSDRHHQLLFCFILKLNISQNRYSFKASCCGSLGGRKCELRGIWERFPRPPRALPGWWEERAGGAC